VAGLYEGFEVGRGVVCGLEKGGLERSHGSQHSCRRLDVLSAEHVEGGPQTGTNGGEQGFGNEAVLGAEVVGDGGQVGAGAAGDGP